MKKHKWKSDSLAAMVMVGPVTCWLILLVAVPLIYVLVMSFCGLDEWGNVAYQFTIRNYGDLFNASYLQIYGQSLLIALATTVSCILFGYPFAYIIARTTSRHKNLFYMLVIIPFWTNSLIRVYGWRTLLGSMKSYNFYISSMNH